MAVASCVHPPLRNTASVSRSAVRSVKNDARTVAAASDGRNAMTKATTMYMLMSPDVMVVRTPSNRYSAKPRFRVSQRG